MFPKVKTVKAKRSNKFRAKRAAGLTSARMYDSTAERDRAEELLVLQRGGFIRALEEQPRIHLVCGIHYHPDFAYIDVAEDRLYCEDVKGVETEGFNLKKRLWKGFGPCPLRIVKRRRVTDAFRFTETIHPGANHIGVPGFIGKALLRFAEWLGGHYG